MKRGERKIVHSRSVKEVNGVLFIVIDPNCKSERGERSIVHSRSYEAKVKEVNGVLFILVVIDPHFLFDVVEAMISSDK